VGFAVCLPPRAPADPECRPRSFQTSAATIDSIVEALIENKDAITCVSLLALHRLPLTLSLSTARPA
jgi:hypothetical protein